MARYLVCVFQLLFQEIYLSFLKEKLKYVQVMLNSKCFSASLSTENKKYYLSISA
jgi:hypothetical protein